MLNVAVANGTTCAQPARLQASAVHPKVSGRLRQLEGLRGVAMLFVFMGHFAPLWTGLTGHTGTAQFFLRLVDADATLGSSFFMLLSGFFGYGSLLRGRAAGDFIRGRLTRLYPLYLVMTAVYIAGSILIPKMSKLPHDPREAAVFIIETLFFLPGLLPIRPMMDVAWTLSFLIAFYFVEVAVAALFRLWGLRRRQRFLFLLLAAVLWAVAGDRQGWWEPRTAALWTGMALSEIVAAFSGSRMQLAIRLAPVCALVTVAGVVARTVLMMSHPQAGMTSLLLYRFLITSISLSAFVWIAYFGPQWWKSLLSAPLLCSLGAASYSFYLTHGLAVKAFKFGIIPWLGAHARSTAVFWSAQAAGLAMSVAIAWAVNHLVEQPAADWIARHRFDPVRVL